MLENIPKNWQKSHTWIEHWWTLIWPLSVIACLRFLIVTSPKLLLYLLMPKYVCIWPIGLEGHTKLWLTATKICGIFILSDKTVAYLRIFWAFLPPARRVDMFSFTSTLILDELLSQAMSCIIYCLRGKICSFCQWPTSDLFWNICYTSKLPTFY